MRGISLIAAGLLIAGAAIAQPSGQPGGPLMIGGKPYERLATRAATREAMLQKLRPTIVHWGEWFMLAPFPFAGEAKGDLAKSLPPEDELLNMGPGGAGPDLKRTYTGKKGVEAAWMPLGDATERKIDFKRFDDNDLQDFAAGYLYTTITADRATVVDVTMGSDDGLRFWLNGRLLVDRDVPRSLDPSDDHVRLDLREGINHVFAKVSQGQGGWEYQVQADPPLDPHVDAALAYQLDLDFPESPEAEYYRAITVPVPPEISLEVGGLDVLPPDASGEARPIVSTRRGDIYIVEGAYGVPPAAVKFTKFATGLHEPLGLSVRVENGRAAVYCVQRGELTRLMDTDGDGVADVYETFCDGWGVSGNYHEFAFGPKFDREGNAWVTLNVGFCASLGKAIVPYRGWALKVTPSGEMIPVCDGLRSPNGIGMFTDGQMFYLDNQGDYVGTNRMTPLLPGSYAGHPASLRWREGWKEGDAAPARVSATIWFPYPAMGQSAADFLLADPAGPSRGAFGPFDGQVFVGDQTICMVNRVFLEKVDGVYQGACFPFRRGLDCGVNRLAWGGDGSMFVGETDRGWGSIGRLRHGLQRIVWSGATPFEVLTMRAAPDGFVLTFTRDVDARAAGDPASYALESYTYEYHAEYGSKEMDKAPQRIVSAEVADARTVRVRVDALRTGDMGYVHELTMPGVRDASGAPLVHAVAYYTLQRIPKN